MDSSQVDAITSATPPTGHLSYTWDLTDANGKKVAPGQYKFFVEGTLRWKNSVLYSGVINAGGDTATVQAKAQYNYEGSVSQPALTKDSPENSMLGPVTAKYTK